MKNLLYQAIIGFSFGFVSFHLSKIFNIVVYGPLYEFDKIRSQLDSDFSYYANIYSNANFHSQTDLMEASQCFRRHSTDLSRFWYKNRFFHLLNEMINGVSKRDIDLTRSELMWYSNSVNFDDYIEKDKRVIKVKKLLKLR